MRVILRVPAPCILMQPSRFADKAKKDIIFFLIGPPAKTFICVMYSSLVSIIKHQQTKRFDMHMDVNK
jgi:hypothetical protein